MNVNYTKFTAGQSDGLDWALSTEELGRVLYLIGVYINPRFFGGAEALSSVLRDAARYGVMAVGMTFVIVNKDIDLSVGSLYGVTAVVFSVAFSQSYFDAGVVPAVGWSIFVGPAVRSRDRREL